MMMMIITIIMIIIMTINNDSRFHINGKVIPMFFMGHAPILA